MTSTGMTDKKPLGLTRQRSRAISHPMKSQIRLALIAAVLTGATLPVVAGGRGEPRQRGQTDVTRAPIKDCTRIVGRNGYYGNPWCNAAEQRTFDRWETRRFGNMRWR